jgi:hypothetical protein
MKAAILPAEKQDDFAFFSELRGKMYRHKIAEISSE